MSSSSDDGDVLETLYVPSLHTSPPHYPHLTHPPHAFRAHRSIGCWGGGAVRYVVSGAASSVHATPPIGSTHGDTVPVSGKLDR